ncbi:uncharacterized protein MELLADRAFT_60797 [Melampsora larici-populina 98AG31]|uniref:DUF155 domain-containing protein n=1 Tax=Melampsora larici-populina (strain 98AG31 / pathotype 3-4-7) TaxID=747676 RepID=F4RCD7_MELLP|nr:uncharacterized protein MELLADRAFT_60797 [Melampsora larici-populina 98AG31]EGG09710.1 hypothetical protein MELLADRAFT_60797 [Melampsora larici-populina 98AG31]
MLRLSCQKVFGFSKQPISTSFSSNHFRSLSSQSIFLNSKHKSSLEPPPSKKRSNLAHGPPSLLKQALKPAHDIRSIRDVVGEVVAYSTAEEYDVRALQHRLARAGYSRPMYNILGEAIWIPEWSPRLLESENTTNQDDTNEKNSPERRTGEVFVFESGSFVSWGLGDAEAVEFLETIIRPTDAQAAERLERNASREVERETMEYRRSRTGPIFEIVSDQIVIGPTETGNNSPSTTRTILTPFPVPSSRPSSNEINIPDHSLLLSKLAVSSALARACRLSRYETQLDEFLSKVEHVPMMLKTGHDSPLDKREIMARYGELLELRQGLSLKDENLLDLPEWFWEDTGAEEKHFKKILREFDFERRLRILNDKLSMGIELQGRLFEFSNSKYSHRLEWIIIILIAFEVGHAMYVADHRRHPEPSSEPALPPTQS